MHNTLKIFADTQGYPVLGEVARCTRLREPIGFARQDQTGLYLVSAPVDPATCPKPVVKAIRSQLKHMGTFSCDKNGTAQLAIKAPMRDQNKLYNRLEQGADALVEVLATHGVQYRQACPLCGRDGCDDFLDQNLTCQPAHAACKASMAQELLDKQQENQATGNYGLAVIGAIIGGFLGIIPVIFGAIFLNVVGIAIMFMFIPMAAYKGYKIARGILSPKVPLIIAAVSIADVMVMFVGFLYVMAWMEFGDLSLGEFFIYFTDIFDVEALLLPLGALVVFTCIGIGLAWGSIRKDTRQFEERARQLHQSMGISDPVVPQ